jgi:hypothetical protein
MAAASSIWQISPTRCQARTRMYRDGQLELEGFPVADISDYLAGNLVTVWLDLRGPEDGDLAVLGGEFGLHPLAALGRRSARPAGPAAQLPAAQEPGAAAPDRLLRDEREGPARVTSPAGCGGR